MLPEDGNEATAIGREYKQVWRDMGVEPRIGTLKRKGRNAANEPPQRVLRSLEEVREWIGDCKRCSLCQGRKNIVFGDGNEKARIVFVGEGPGADEDEQGLPFVGRAGQLLDRIIEAMGYKREEIYIANIVKCRPPSNRTPLPDEIAACSPFLKTQLDLIKPDIVVALGLTSTTLLTGREGPISGLRGRIHSVFWRSDIPVMPTYHPAYLLRNPSAKKLVWEDIKKVKDFVEQPKESR